MKFINLIFFSSLSAVISAVPLPTVGHTISRSANAISNSTHLPASEALQTTGYIDSVNQPAGVESIVGIDHGAEFPSGIEIPIFLEITLRKLNSDIPNKTTGSIRSRGIIMIHDGHLTPASIVTVALSCLTAVVCIIGLIIWCRQDRELRKKNKEWAEERHRLAAINLRNLLETGETPPKKTKPGSAAHSISRPTSCRLNGRAGGVPGFSGQAGPVKNLPTI